MWKDGMAPRLLEDFFYNQLSSDNVDKYVFQKDLFEIFIQNTTCPQKCFETKVKSMPEHPKSQVVFKKEMHLDQSKIKISSFTHPKKITKIIDKEPDL